MRYALASTVLTLIATVILIAVVVMPFVNEALEVAAK